MNKAEETKREKAKQFRYRKPIVRNINLASIREELNDIEYECDNVRYYWEQDDDTLINALDGDEDEAGEFKMMFADLCAECEQMREDLENEYIPECFDILFVAAGAGDYGGGYLGWDAYEQDYFGIGLSDEFIKSEGAKKLKQMTKVQIIECTAACLKVLYAYIGLRYRYDSMKAAFDILRDENTGHLKVAKQIEELYEKAEQEWFIAYSPATRELDKMLDALPQEEWIK
ncbi:MAG: hypothetical protein IJ567_06440 [Lachnospiraceae bacterium]|nr:hypothetical protein [Lachnospiraceae bacterium]